MSDTNTLVDDHTRITAEQYSGNPVTAGPSGTFDGDNWFQGIAPFEDFEEYLDALRQAQDGSWATAVFELCSGSLGLGMDALGFVEDPIGTITQWAASWLLEHLKPFRLILDELAGNPTVVQAYASNWAAIQNRLSEVVPDYDKVAHSVDWRGAAATAFQADADTTVKAMALLAECSGALSTLTKTAGELVAAVRATVRDITAQLVAGLVDVITDVLTGGAYTEAAEAGAATRVAHALPKVIKVVKGLIKVLEDAGDLVGAIRTILETAWKILEDNGIVSSYSPPD